MSWKNQHLIIYFFWLKSFEFYRSNNCTADVVLNGGQKVLKAILLCSPTFRTSQKLQQMAFDPFVDKIYLFFWVMSTVGVIYHQERNTVEIFVEISVADNKCLKSDKVSWFHHVVARTDPIWSIWRNYRLVTLNISFRFILWMKRMRFLKGYMESENQQKDMTLFKL